MSDRIPLACPEITEADIQAVSAVMRTGTLSRGQSVAQFEAEVCTLTGSAHAVAMSSGTAVLQALMDALDIGPDDEVIVPSFTVPATANPVVHRGGRVVFCDIDAQTLGVTADTVEALISARTRAVIAVYPFGMPLRIGALKALCDRHELPLIEDSCEALGTISEGRHAGRHGLAGCFGFYPNKQITTGEGGICITDDAQLADRLRLIRNHGRAMDGQWLDQQLAGHNFRLSELQAALGLSQLARWTQTLERRTALARRYDDLLSEERRVRHHRQHIRARDRASLFCYHLSLVSDRPVTEVRQCRDRIVTAMFDRGIQCGRYFSPLHLQPWWQQPARAACEPLPVTERVAAGSLVLPYFTILSQSEQLRIVEQLVNCLDAEGLTIGH